MGDQVVIDVAEDEFEQRVLHASHELPVVVDFWAGWCQPCLVLSPVLEQLAEEHGGRFLLAKVDVDRSQRLAAEYGIQGIPAVKAFLDGEVVDEFVGVQPEEVLRRWLRGFVPSEAAEVVAAAREAAAGGDQARAEELYRRALDVDPEDEDATLGLARVLMEAGRVQESRSLVDRLPGNAEARRLGAEIELRSGATDEAGLEQLRARVAAAPEDDEAAISLARAEAAAGTPGDALERCIRVIHRRGEGRDAGRDLMVRIFETLGDEHPLVQEYRPRLASALY